jgi:hypothetical protein
MKRIIIAAVAGAALFAGASAASAQTFQNDGPSYGYNRGPMVERGVGLQIGPVGVGGYDNGAAYNDGYSYQGTARGTERRARTPDAYNMRAFRSQEVWPQSPPTGS